MIDFQGAMNSTSYRHGFTRTELIVALVVVGVLIMVAIPAVVNLLHKGQLAQALKNASSIYLATFSMSTERVSETKDSNGWPGDLVASGTMQCKVTDFVKVLVKNNYLKPRDSAVFAAAGVTPFRGSDINQFSATPGPNNNCAFTIYCIQESDGANSIFISTINATLDVPNSTFTIKPNAQPFGDRGYVVFHRGGDGAICRPQQTTNTSLQGTPCKMALSGTAALSAE